MTLKRAFEHCANDYARFRPGYPDRVFDVLEQRFGRGRTSSVADLGSGTGIFTVRLAARGWRVIAIDPSRAMLALMPDRYRRIQARGEATALAGASVDLITVAQAFHWFNPPAALAEFGRILESGGGLALCWNNRDPQRSPFLGQFEALVQRFNPAYETDYRSQDWARKIEQSGIFLNIEYDRVEHDWIMKPEEFVGFTRSASYIRNVLSRDQRLRFEDELRGLMESHFAGSPCALPMWTDLWTAVRRPRTSTP